MYEYKAYVRKVYDGDTITVDIDLGFGVVLKNQKIRLSRINTPEIRGDSRENGLKVRNLVRDRISNKWITVKTTKDKKGKYGRWLGEIYCSGSKESINQWLLNEGHAKAY